MYRTELRKYKNLTIFICVLWKPKAKYDIKDKLVM